MRFRIIHTTRYRYERPVLLQPHMLRLRPRCGSAQRLIDFRLRVQPRPRGHSESLDLDGNSVEQVWFDGLTPSLTVVSTALVETQHTDPFNFLLEPWATSIPLRLPDELAAALRPYQLRALPDTGVEQFASAVLQEVDQQSITFANTLSRRIAEICRSEVRLDGDPQPPGLTLQRRAGACRDFAVLFMDACRAVGLAARFVSGYYGGGIDTEKRYPHAWAEVFLPGGGWRGFDPLQGLAVDDLHVAVAASAHASGAAPISGIFLGSNTSSSLQVELHMHLEDTPALA